MSPRFRRLGLQALLVVAVLLLAGCFGRTKKDEQFNAGDVPASFDVTLVAAKDNQFDYQDAPLTAEDLRSAFRYRKDESQPLTTVLIKRGEKQKVKDEHIVALARMAHDLGFKAYVQDKDGTSEIRTSVKVDPPAQP